MDTLHDFLHSIIAHFIPHEGNDYRPHLLQKGAFFGLLAMVILTFTLANFQALLWQSSHWLVGAVLPAVVVDLTNVQRHENNLATLNRNPVLDAAANLKAQDMAKNSYFAHNSPTGITPWHWFEQAGYAYVYAGENLAVYFTDSNSVVDAWMKSPTHRANIVGTHYTEIGVGTAKGTYNGYDTVYVVQLFGAPAVMPPVAVGVKKSPVVKVSTTSVPIVRTVRTGTTSSTSRARVAPVAARAVLGAEIAKSSTSTNPVLATTVEGDDALPTTPGSDPDVTVQVEANAPVVSGEAVPVSVISQQSLNDMTVVESGLATSHTNLPAAPVSSVERTLATPIPAVARLATEPNHVLQVIYLCIGVLTLLALFASVLIEWRQHRPLQTIYGILLLLVMCGLFALHISLSGHVLIV